MQLEEPTLKPESAAIACRQFPGDHTYDKIAEGLHRIHEEFGLHNRKILATITDNGSNFVKAFKEFGVNFGKTVFIQFRLSEFYDSGVAEPNFGYCM